MEDNVKKKITSNEDMLNKLQEFCKENNLDIKVFKVVQCRHVWKIILERKG